MSMNDFFESSQIIESLYSNSNGKIGAAALSALPFAKSCLEKGNIASSDCRLAISKLITANAHAMIPRMVENLDTCLAKRHYPAGYEVDYFFPPVGCAKESSAILVAHQLFFKSTKKN